MEDSRDDLDSARRALDRAYLHLASYMLNRTEFTLDDDVTLRTEWTSVDHDNLAAMRALTEAMTTRRRWWEAHENDVLVDLIERAEADADDLAAALREAGEHDVAERLDAARKAMPEAAHRYDTAVLAVAVIEANGVLRRAHQRSRSATDS